MLACIVSFQRFFFFSLLIMTKINSQASWRVGYLLLRQHGRYGCVPRLSLAKRKSSKVAGNVASSPGSEGRSKVSCWHVLLLDENVIEYSIDVFFCVVCSLLKVIRRLMFSFVDCVLF